MQIGDGRNRSGTPRRWDPKRVRSSNRVGMQVGTVVAGILSSLMLWSVVEDSDSTWAQDSAANSRVWIEASELHVGNGEVLRPGSVLVENGKIQAVGSGLERPDGVPVLEVFALMPGLVDAASDVGVSGGAGEVTSEVTPDFQVSAALDVNDPALQRLCDSGVTTVHVTPSSDNVIAGFSGVLKTRGDGTTRWLHQQAGMWLSMCNDPTARNSSRSRPEGLYVRQPTNRMGVVWILRSRLHAAAGTPLAELDAANPGEATPGADPNLRGVIEKTFPTYAVSRTSYDIETLYRIADEFKIEPVLVGGHEAYKVVDLLKSENAKVIFTGLSTSTNGPERTELCWGTPARLEEAGVTFALAGDGLLNQARWARRFGVSESVALAAITSRPAEILGISDRVGRIAPGLDADLVALGGTPLQATTALEWVMIDGIVQIKTEGR